MNGIAITRIIVLLSGLALYPFHVQALSPADRDTVTEQQQQRLEQNQQQRDELMRSLQPPRPSVSPPSQPVTGPCFTLRRINIDNASLLSDRIRARLVAPYLHQCLDMPHINQLVSDVSGWYIGRGYITSRAFLSEQNLSSGQLIIPVMEGRLQQIRMAGMPARTLQMAFPGLEGEILT